jgi:hypothetical protein
MELVFLVKMCSWTIILYHLFAVTELQNCLLGQFQLQEELLKVDDVEKPAEIPTNSGG